MEGPKRGPKRSQSRRTGRSAKTQAAHHTLLQFDPRNLDRTVIAIPLLEEMEKLRKTEEPSHLPIRVIIDLNLTYPGGRNGARERVQAILDELWRAEGRSMARVESANLQSPQYVFEQLTADQISELVRRDGQTERRAIYRVWPDFKVQRMMIKSSATVKADAACKSFAATGHDIVWAVADSGIDKGHPHFRMHGNLELDPPLSHKSFLSDPKSDPCVDECGHGTHVAGIIGGELRARDPNEKPRKGQPYRIKEIKISVRDRTENGEETTKADSVPAIAGIAARCKLVSLKVLGARGEGNASSLIAALEEVQRLNEDGRRIRIHGVNLSVGYDFDPKWFACGQSPLCVEVDRLVRSGVVVVIAAGNSGFVFSQQVDGQVTASGKSLSITDPGNASLAITVGSTHRDMPHIYGVSYFSSKGPTGDGRPKPDVIAPGERIISCGAGNMRTEAAAKGVDGLYIEESGTSMAAPHVSGVIAAFLSVRREFIGRPEAVKDIFMSTATDLKRDRTFQGAGLVDLMRAIQSV